MRRAIITGVILILNLVLQSTLLQGIQIRGIVPNTAIIIIVSFSLFRGSGEGAVIGLCAGLLQDIFFGSGIGYYGLLGMAAGYFCGMAHRDFYRENYFLPILLCAAATLLYESTIYLTGFFFSGNLNFLYYFINLILPETVYTALFSIIVYRILFGINDSLERKERHKRRLF